VEEKAENGVNQTNGSEKTAEVAAAALAVATAENVKADLSPPVTQPVIFEESEENVGSLFPPPRHSVHHVFAAFR
jgi:hypothetical protein